MKMAVCFLIDGLAVRVFQKDRAMNNVTFDEILQRLRKGKRIELKFNLNFGLYSRHELRLDDRIIVDESYVDGSVSRSSIAEYRRSFYGKAFTKNAVQLLGEH
jgi:hypothetical protein